MLFPTTLVGSYPQPELWRIAEPWLHEAQDDATLLAIRAQEEAGLDIVTDGEIRRESYSNRFATALEGVLTKLDGKQIMVGCLDLNDLTVEAPETIVARIRRALPHVRPEHVILAPDCGMKYLPRDVAFGKMTAMVAAAKLLRAEFGGRADL